MEQLKLIGHQEDYAGIMSKPTLQKIDVDFAALCKKIRTQLNLTQTEMAKKLGASLRGYQHWEAGERKPGATAAYKLAKLETALQMQAEVIDDPFVKKVSTKPFDQSERGIKIGEDV